MGKCLKSPLAPNDQHSGMQETSFSLMHSHTDCLERSQDVFKACMQHLTKTFESVKLTHTTILLLFWNLSGTTQVSRYQKGKTRKVKTNLDLLQQEIVSGCGICWAMCKSAPHPRQPCQHPTTQFFTGRMPFLPPNQQRQSTEGKEINTAYV